ncbi:MAG: hypothetical protein K9L65_13150 [Chromatiaceae bacterium]|nr:hypothetical protein [Chromatiaceae bacterium]
MSIGFFPDLFLPRLSLILLLSASLLGCGADRQPLRIGGKQSPESQIVAEMVAELAEAQGIPVMRRIGLGSTRLTLEALKRGEIDLYPEYTGTGLAMLGLAPASNAESAMAQVRERFAPLGLAWSDPLGFNNDFELAMLRDRARALGIRSYSDLAQQSTKLSIGVDSEFRQRPIDGLRPLSRRYGLQFDEIVEVPPADRIALYDQLIDGRIDLALVHDTDGQIDDFDLLLLDDDLGFFPTYEAALLYREAAVDRFPALSGVLDQLAETLSIEDMRRLSRRVTLRGEDPSMVARDELIRLGLIDGTPGERTRQALSLAVSPSANADGEAGKVLRTLRRSFPTRTVQLVRAADPLGAVENGTTRLALVSAPAFFAPGSVDPTTGQPPRRSGLEAVGLVGTSYLQAFALDPEIKRLEDAAFIATGPEGSSGYRAAQSVVDGLQLTATLVPVEGDTAEALAEAMIQSRADAVLLMQPIGNSTALALIERGLALIAIDNWNQGNNRIVFPYLQPARLNPAAYAPFMASTTATKTLLAKLGQPIDTLVTQLVIAGPAPVTDSALGDHGPGASFIPNALPLTDLSVERLNAALDQDEEIYPILPQARALAPRLPKPPDPLNPSPGASLLTFGVVAMLIWMVWLLLRPAARTPSVKQRSSGKTE